jgi:hypothetical protein
MGMHEVIHANCKNLHLSLSFFSAQSYRKIHKTSLSSCHFFAISEKKRIFAEELRRNINSN